MMFIKEVLTFILLLAFSSSIQAAPTITFEYGPDTDKKPIPGVKLTQTESDGTVTIYASNAEGQITLTTTTNTYTLAASLAETGTDPISVQDALYILQHIVELRTLNADQIKAADINGDGNLTIQDALKVLQHNVELITLEPSLSFYDTNTGNALSTITFSPGNTPLITVIRQGDANLSFEPDSITDHAPILTGPMVSYSKLILKLDSVADGCSFELNQTSGKSILHLDTSNNIQVNFNLPIVYKTEAVSFRVSSSTSPECLVEKDISIDITPDNSSEYDLLTFSNLNPELDTRLQTNYFGIDQVGLGFRWTTERYSGTFCYADICTTEENALPAVGAVNFSIGDFNGDGHQDFATIMKVLGSRGYQGSDRSSKNTLLILLNDGLGNLYEDSNFIDISNVPEVRAAYRMKVADFNSDGKDDIFISSFGKYVCAEDNTCSSNPANHGLLMTSENQMLSYSHHIADNNDGNGFLRPAHDASAGDIDGDGDIDIIASGYIMYNDGDGIFSKYKDLEDQWYGGFDEYDNYTQNPIDASSVADFNGDGVDDIILWFRSDSESHCSTGNSDQKAEAYCGGYIKFGPILETDNVHVNDDFARLANGDGYYGLNTHFNNSVTGDIDGDGDIDVLVGETRKIPYYNGRTVQILINDGDGNFEDKTDVMYPNQLRSGLAEIVAPIGIGEGDVYMVDFDGDGDMDIVDNVGACNIGTNCAEYADTPRTVIALNDGNNVFSEIPHTFLPQKIEMYLIRGYDGYSSFIGSDSPPPDAHPQPDQGSMDISIPINLDNQGSLDFVSILAGHHYRTANSPDAEEKAFGVAYTVINKEKLQ